MPTKKECLRRRIIDLISTSSLLLLHPPRKAKFEICLFSIIMNKYKTNAGVEALHQYSEKESPPFALDDHFPSPTEQRHDKFRQTSSDFLKSNPTQSPTTNLDVDSKCVKLTSTHYDENHSAMPSYSQHSSHSTPPDLTESAMTEGTSYCSDFSAPKSDITKSMNNKMKMPSSPSLSRHTSMMSSILSTSSLTNVPLEPRLPNADFYPVDNGSFKTTSSSFTNPHTIIRQPETNLCSIGFSELMKAADDSSVELEQSLPASRLTDHRSNGRLPPLLESQEVESGALITAAPQFESGHKGKVRKWWHNVPLYGSGSHTVNQELERPLMSTIAGTNANDAPSGQLHITRLLSNDCLQHHYANLALERASASVETKIEGDNSFEVSFLLGENAQCTVDDVVEVISNTDLLNLWCNPIETLIVTSNSSEGSSFTRSLDETSSNNECEGLTGSSNCHDDNKRIREYEAEWIEATTSSLESPSSSASFILSAGQSVLRSLGLTSYGKITMFIERRHGRIGLTVGPFNVGVGVGVVVSHSISISSEDPSSSGGRIRIVDRVRLIHDNEEEMYFLGRMFGCAMGSCLSHFFFPSIDGYVDQATMSMARLRILLEHDENY